MAQRVIETNLLIDDCGNIADHQSRVIEVDSWEDFIKEIKDAKCVVRNSCLDSLHGTTIPMSSKVENLIYDHKRLSCDVYNYMKVHTKKLVYRI